MFFQITLFPYCQFGFENSDTPEFENLIFKVQRLDYSCRIALHNSEKNLHKSHISITLVFQNKLYTNGYLIFS